MLLLVAMVAPIKNPPEAYALFIDTICDGLTPSWWDETGYPITFATKREAQLEIADTLLHQITQFQNGEREFDDAINVEDQILPVSLHPDGSIELENGQVFGSRD